MSNKEGYTLSFSQEKEDCPMSEYWGNWVVVLENEGFGKRDKNDTYYLYENIRVPDLFPDQGEFNGNLYTKLVSIQHESDEIAELVSFIWERINNDDLDDFVKVIDVQEDHFSGAIELARKRAHGRPVYRGDGRYSIEANLNRNWKKNKRRNGKAKRVRENASV